MKTINGSRKQSGAVSLFVVVFAMLMMSVMTISFVRIMTKDQSQASGNDLAQSAYDSAQAGVEDAKRSLIWYTEQCKISASACNDAATVINSAQCNSAIRNTVGPATGTGEIKVQQSVLVDEADKSIDQALDQAYTCVTMNLETEDYITNLPADQSVLVPLVARGEFTSITVQWFTSKDVSSPETPITLDGLSGKALRPQADWGRRPSVLRTQFMQVGPDFSLSEFDGTTDSKSNANTVFLYPSSAGSNNEDFTSRDIRGTSSDERTPADPSWTPLATRCEQSAILTGGYACSMTLRLPDPVGASNRVGARSYLRLTPLYVGSQIRVTLGDGARFNGVQPVVDSTGRASTVFRRVESRVDLFDTTSFPYPDAALEVTGNLCKDFGVTSSRYIDGNCTP